MVWVRLYLFNPLPTVFFWAPRISHRGLPYSQKKLICSKVNKDWLLEYLEWAMLLFSIFHSVFRQKDSNYYPSVLLHGTQSPYQPSNGWDKILFCLISYCGSHHYLVLIWDTWCGRYLPTRLVTLKWPKSHICQQYWEVCLPVACILKAICVGGTNRYTDPINPALVLWSGNDCDTWKGRRVILWSMNNSCHTKRLNFAVKYIAASSCWFLPLVSYRPPKVLKVVPKLPSYEDATKRGMYCIIRPTDITAPPAYKFRISDGSSINGDDNAADSGNAVAEGDSTPTNVFPSISSWDFNAYGVHRGSVNSMPEFSRLYGPPESPYPGDVSSLQSIFGMRYY